VPLQNRVTPHGEIVALPGRGTLTGNRGIVVGADGCVARPFQVKRWITCVLEWKGKRRPLNRPNHWTPLFFLDEAAAFSAGHRPCAFCRNADYKRFRTLWEQLYGPVRSVDEIDTVLHGERIKRRAKVTYEASIAGLPDGTYVQVDGMPWLVRGDMLYAWSDAGYTHSIARPPEQFVTVLTPRSLVAVFRAGYQPAMLR